MALEIIQEVDDRQFWHQATKYASAIGEDEPFVEELAYMMVTLHQTGA